MSDRLKRVLSLVFALILLIDGIWLLAQDKIHFGIALPMVIGLGLLLYVIFFTYFKRWQQSTRFKTTLWKLLWSGFFLWLLSVAIFFAYIQYSSSRSDDHSQPVKAILVLGSGIENGQPSPTLQKRLDTAAIYALHHQDTLLIMTGGIGFQQKYSEAEVMETYLRKHYPELRNPIALEERSTSTAENLQYVQPILEQWHIRLNDPILLVTSDFHTIRARAIAQHQGYQQVMSLSAETPLYIRYNSWLREYFAFLSGWLLNEY